MAGLQKLFQFKYSILENILYASIFYTSSI